MVQIYDPILDQWIESESGETTQTQGSQTPVISPPQDTWPADQEQPEPPDFPEQPQEPPPDTSRPPVVEFWDANNRQWYKTEMGMQDTKQNIGGKEVSIPGVITANETQPMLYRVDGKILDKPDTLKGWAGESTDYETNLPAVLPPGYTPKEKPVAQVTQPTLSPELQFKQDIIDKISSLGGAFSAIDRGEKTLVDQAVELGLYRDANGVPLTKSDFEKLYEKYQSSDVTGIIANVESMGGVLGAIQSGQIEQVRQAIDKGYYQIPDPVTGVQRPMTQLDLVDLQINIANQGTQRWALDEITRSAPNAIGADGIYIEKALASGIDPSVLRMAGIPAESVESARLSILDQKALASKGLINDLETMSEALGTRNITIGPAPPEKGGLIGAFTFGSRKAIFGQEGILSGLLAPAKIGEGKYGYLGSTGIIPIVRDNMSAPIIGNLISVEAAREAGFNPSVGDWTLASVLTAAQIIPFFVKLPSGGFTAKYASGTAIENIAKGRSTGVPVEGLGQIRTLEGNLVSIPVETIGGQQFASGSAISDISKMPVVWDKGARFVIVMGEEGQPLRIPVSSLESFGQPLRVFYEESGGQYKPFYYIGKEKIPISPERPSGGYGGMPETPTGGIGLAPAGTGVRVVTIPETLAPVMPRATPMFPVIIPSIIPERKVEPVTLPAISPAIPTLPITQPGITGPASVPVIYPTPAGFPIPVPIPTMVSSPMPIPTVAVVPTPTTIATPVPVPTPTSTPVPAPIPTPPAAGMPVPTPTTPPTVPTTPKVPPSLLPPLGDGRIGRAGSGERITTNTNLSGKVTNDAGIPLELVKVTLTSNAGAKVIKYTDKNGIYKFLEINPDYYALSSEKEAYTPVNIRILVNLGDNIVNVRTRLAPVIPQPTTETNVVVVPGQERPVISQPVTRYVAGPAQVIQQPVRRITEPQRIIAVDRGAFWLVIYPPYKKNNIDYMKFPPGDAVLVKGIGAAYKTINSMGGNGKVLLGVDYGAFKAVEERNNIKRPQKPVKFQRKKKKTRKAIMPRW